MNESGRSSFKTAATQPRSRPMGMRRWLSFSFGHRFYVGDGFVVTQPSYRAALARRRTCAKFERECAWSPRLKKLSAYFPDHTHPSR